MRGAENSDVFPPGPVAVAVTNCPAGAAGKSETLNAARPAASVVTVVVAGSNGVWPSSAAAGVAPALAKNWRVNVVLGVLSSTPDTCIVAPELTAEVSTGKFWSVLGPASASGGWDAVSLGVTPSGARSMPTPALEKIELP